MWKKLLISVLEAVVPQLAEKLIEKLKGKDTK